MRHQSFGILIPHAPTRIQKETLAKQLCYMSTRMMVLPAPFYPQNLVTGLLSLAVMFDCFATPSCTYSMLLFHIIAFSIACFLQLGHSCLPAFNHSSLCHKCCLLSSWAQCVFFSLRPCFLFHSHVPIHPTQPMILWYCLPFLSSMTLLGPSPSLTLSSASVLVDFNTALAMRRLPLQTRFFSNPLHNPTSNLSFP